MENNYKRQYRQMDDSIKQKISASLKGKSKTPTHKSNISNGMKEMWKHIPNKPKSAKDLGLL